MLAKSELPETDTLREVSEKVYPAVSLASAHEAKVKPLCR